MQSGDMMTIREVLDIRLSTRALITVVLLHNGAERGPETGLRDPASMSAI